MGSAKCKNGERERECECKMWSVECEVRIVVRSIKWSVECEQVECEV